MNSKIDNWKKNFQKKIIKGKPIKVNQRTIYPVIQITNISIMDNFWFESISPIAIAVIEPYEKYFVPLNEEEKRINELLEDDGLWDELGIDI